MSVYSEILEIVQAFTAERSFDTNCHDEELPLIELDTTKDWKKFLRAFIA